MIIMQEIQIKDTVLRWLARNFPRFAANIPTSTKNNFKRDIEEAVALPLHYGQQRSEAADPN